MKPPVTLSPALPRPLERPAPRRLAHVIAGLSALLPLACGLGDDPLEENTASDESTTAGADLPPPRGDATDLTVTRPTAATTQCLDNPSVTNCCTNEVVTNGTPLADVAALAAASAHCAFGYEGDDDYDGGDLADILVGGPGNDVLDGGLGDDTLLGSAGTDTLRGEAGRDVLLGGEDADQMWGGDQADRLDGGGGNDRLYGNGGDDLLIGGLGGDEMRGHAGNDVFVIHHPCEVGDGEIIDGGDGYDILVSPVPQAELQNLGAQIVHIERVIVDASKQHLSECSAPPAEDPGIHSLTTRREVNLGCRRRMPGKYSQACEDEAGWATTDRTHWLNVPETTTKFLATHDDATAVITFAADAAGNESVDQKGSRSPIFIRALVDGQPVEPGEMRLVFDAGADPGVVTFVATHVPRGIHNVRFQWRVDEDAFFEQFDDFPIAKLHGADVSVNVDAANTEVAGVAGTPANPQGFTAAGPIGTVGAWDSIEDPDDAGAPLTVMAYIKEGATTTVTFTGEVHASDFSTLEIRAKVDGLAGPFLVNAAPYAQRFPLPYWDTGHPSDVKPYGHASRSFTFATGELSEGWHSFTFEGRVRLRGTEMSPGDFANAGIHGASILGRAAAVVSTVPDEVAGIEVAAAASDSLITTIPESFEVVPGLEASVTLPADSQVHVRADLSVRDVWRMRMRLVVDGEPVPETEREAMLTSGYVAGTVSTDFVLKRLPAGAHEFAIEWEGLNMLAPPMETRHRALTVRVEPLHTPDLGRGPDVGAGASGKTQYRESIQAFDGEIQVLPIIVDPLRPQVERVYFTADEDGEYELAVDNVPFNVVIGQGQGADEVIDDLVLAINAANLGVSAEKVVGDLVCAGCSDAKASCFGCVADMLLVADSLGADAFTVEVNESPAGNNAPVMRTQSLSNAPLPSSPDYLNILFGSWIAESSEAYWLHQSRGLAQLRSVVGTTTSPGVLGPYEPALTGVTAVQEYWQRAYPETCDPMDPQTYPYRGGHHRRYFEGLVQADATVNFAELDVDGDGVVRTDELVLVFITPQAGSDGFHRRFAPFCVDQNGDPADILEFDGVELDLDILEWYSNNGTIGFQENAVIAHELGHSFDLDDMYISKDLDSDGVPDVGCRWGNCTEHEAWAKSIMDATASGDLGIGHWSELDGFHKLALGWVTPRTIRTSTSVALEQVKTSREVLILPREGSGAREYFLIENRVDAAAINNGYDVSIGDSGLAVWHVVEPEYAEHWQFDGGSPDLGCWEQSPTAANCHLMGIGHQCQAPDDIYDFADTTQNYVRRAVRLVRPGDFASKDGSDSLWSSIDGPVSNQGDACGPGILTWADGTSSPYQLTNISPAGGNMFFCVEVDGAPCP